MSTVSLDGSYEDACNSDDLLPKAQQKNSHGQQTQQWCDKYEEDMVTGTYNGPKHIANAFVELGLDRESRILDILAGPGLVAELLRPHGYTNIDAIDGSKDMLAAAQKKELYKNYYIALLGAHRKAPVADATYDAVIASGSFGPHHLYSDVFGDIIRVVKSGGIIMWSMRSDYELTSPRFCNFDADVEKLVTKGVWKHRVPRKDIDQYLLGSNGYIYTMQKM